MEWIVNIYIFIICVIFILEVIFIVNWLFNLYVRIVLDLLSLLMEIY